MIFNHALEVVAQPVNDLAFGEPLETDITLLVRLLLCPNLPCNAKFSKTLLDKDRSALVVLLRAPFC